MKRNLLLLFFVCLLIEARAQVIITGYFPEPEGTDAPVGGGWEYIQLRATENINFATTPYAVVIANIGAGLPSADGWATPGATGAVGTSTKNYQFSLTTGSVNKGDFFYVGNIFKLICGTVSSVNSTDISETATLPANRAIWIRNKNVGNEAGDGGIGVANTAGFLPYGQNSAVGIGVFVGGTITSTSIPIDAVFYGNTIGNSYASANPTFGFLVPTNDLYNPVSAIDQSAQKLFGQGTNTKLIAPRSASGDKFFYALGGDYNTTTKVWDTPRSLTKIQLNVSSQLSAIQSGTGTNTLPVNLTSFSGKVQPSGIALKWNTATESNSSHFEITRSTDGNEFKNIGSVLSVGNSISLKSYSFTDNAPVAGVNYYQLQQKDLNGNSEKSEIIAVNNNLISNTFTINATNTSANAIVNAVSNATAIISITDIAGKKVFEKNFQIEKGQNTLKIDLSKTSAGVYVASLVIAHKKTVVVKFVKP